MRIRRQQEEGLRQIVADHRAEMDFAVEQGLYQSWRAEDESDFSIDTHPLLATGTRVSLRLQLDGIEDGSTNYLFYRPPFALKVRASYPGNANEVTEQGIDAAVREMIPAVKVTAPVVCQGRVVELSQQVGFDVLNEAGRERASILMVTSATLRYALNGSMDLTTALRMASAVCESHNALCGHPPWTSGDQE